eukprot:CFRG5243T1
MFVRDVVLDLSAGSLGGMAGITVGQPFEVLKTRMQARRSPYKNSLQCLKMTVREEGVRALWKGLGPPLSGVALYQAICFASYEATKTALKQSNLINEPQSIVLMAGLASGCATTVVTTPTDLIKIQMQLDRGTGQAKRYPNMFSCLRHIVRRDGLRGLYRGYMVCLARDAPSTLAYFMAYEETKYFLAKHNVNEHTATFIAGGMAGLLSWGCIIPIDRMKTQIQATASHGSNLSILGCAASIVREEGAKGFFRGGGQLLLRAFPVNAVTFLVYERMLDALKGTVDDAKDAHSTMEISVEGSELSISMP